MVLVDASLAPQQLATSQELGSAAENRLWHNVQQSEHPLWTMAEYPKSVGDHRVDDRWVCTNCGTAFDCLTQFRQTTCA